VNTICLDDALSSKLQKEGKRLLREIAVYQFANNLIREISGEVFTGRINLKRADRMYKAIADSIEEAVRKRRPTIIGKAVMYAVGDSETIMKIVSRMCRFARKQVGEGFALLISDERAEKEIRRFLVNVAGSPRSGQGRADILREHLWTNTPRKYYLEGLEKAVVALVNVFKTPCSSWR